MKATARILVAAALAFASVTATGCGYGQTFGVDALAAQSGSAGAKSATGGVTVTVIDANSQPVVGATITLSDAQGKAIGSPATADAEGKATFKLAAGKSYVALARFKGLSASHPLDVEGEGPVLVSVLLASASSAKGMINGSVIDAFTGKPLHGAQLSILGTAATVRTNPDGSFQLGSVPTGSPTLVASYPGFRDQKVALAVRAGQSAVAKIKLQPGANAQRLGHTLVATEAGVYELDASANKIWSTRKGGAQARLLAGSGNVLIAAGNRVDEVTPTGTVAWSYKPLLFGALAGAQGAFRAASGNTFIADTDHNRVIEVSTTQTIQRSVKFDFSRPMSVERLAHTTLVADTGHNRVVEVNDAGQVVWAFGDGAPETLNRPTHVTRLPGGNTLVTDTGNSRILEITPDYKLAWSYGGDGNRETCFVPNSATRLPDGSTLVADTGNHRVIEVSPAGDIVWNAAVEAPLFAERL